MDCVLSLFLGLFIIPVSCDFPPGSCDGYIEINEPWRNRAFASTPFTGYSQNDADFLGKWLRFTGIGGDTVITSCLTVQTGATLVPIFIPFPLPTNLSLYPTNGTAKGCNEHSFLVSVALCPGEFYVYKPEDPLPAPDMVYVTYHSKCTEKSCGPLGNCTAGGGCICNDGYEMPPDNPPTSTSYGCIDINECTRTKGICGYNTNCYNTVGSYSCNCWEGFQLPKPIPKLKLTPGCEDIDECLSGVCGPYGTCYNTIGSFVCNCSKGFRADYKMSPICQGLYCTLQYSINVIRTSCNFLTSDVDECYNSTICGPYSICENLPGNYSCSCKVGFEPMDKTKQPNETNSILKIKYIDKSKLFLFNKWFSISFVMRKLPGSATAAFMTLNGMESLLSHQYFQTEKKTDMCSDVITAIIPVNNTNLTEPVNFTIYHRKVQLCVYWKTTETVEGKSMSWSEEGCWVAFSNENYTICSCSHLSTFALIMQIGEWLNRVCVIIGLFFLALAIFTFLLCSWNPKINNTARLHLCLNLFFSQLLLLWNDKYTDNKLACTVMAGLLHFLIVASFVWMLLEALQLHLLVRKLSQVQVIRRDGLPRPILYLVGYGIPFVIVGVSALIYSDGYGVTSSNVCFLSTKRNFNWALTGPIIAINWLLFLATLWSLRPTLANMKSDVSQSKDTRLIIFKIVAQFVILGCTWILGLYQSNLFFQVLFIILNSQQGTFLYIVHCLLNKEVREEYIKWLTCSIGKEAAEVSLVKNIESCHF
uniref:Adhesion G protein-coupled receptor E8 n=1 Tax=Astatotilapia calliptera TaxID=8154 RepID=A0A3P8NK54_ASTCA